MARSAEACGLFFGQIQNTTKFIIQKRRLSLSSLEKGQPTCACFSIFPKFFFRARRVFLRGAVPTRYGASVCGLIFFFSEREAFLRGAVQTPEAAARFEEFVLDGIQYMEQVCGLKLLVHEALSS